MRSGPGEAVLEAELAADLGELERAIGRAVVGEHGLEADAEARVPVDGGVQRAHHRSTLLVRVDVRVKSGTRKWN